MAQKKMAQKKEKRVLLTISGLRPSTIEWFKQRAFEADLPFSKYISLLLDGVKKAGENEGEEGGGGNRTRQFLAEFLHGRRAERKAA